MSDLDGLEFAAIIHQVVKLPNGIDLGVEMLPGQVRFPDARYARKLKSGYGHARNYLSQDNSALDVYLSSSLLSPDEDGHEEALNAPLWMVSQVDPETGELDEEKLMVGYLTERDATKAYLQEMPVTRFGDIREVSLDDLNNYKRSKVEEPTVDEDQDEANFAREDAPNYRLSEDWHQCQNCKFSYRGNDRAGSWLNCDAYDFEVDPVYVCDSWRESNTTPENEVENDNGEPIGYLDGDSLIFYEPQSVMLAFYPSPEIIDALAIDGFEEPDDMHITLAYFGKVDQIYNFSQLASILAYIAQSRPAPNLAVSGWGYFNATESSDGFDVLYASIDSPDLIPLRLELIEAMEADFQLKAMQNHGYTPHITLAYLDAGGMKLIPNFRTMEFTPGGITLVVGDQWVDFPYGDSASFAVPKKYEHIDFKPPKAVQEAAQMGLDLRAKQTPSNKGGMSAKAAAKEGIRSGVSDAYRIAKGEALTPEKVKAMWRYWNRHKGDSSGEGWGDKEKPSKGYQAFLLWGFKSASEDDPGVVWVKKILAQMEAADKADMNEFEPPAEFWDKDETPKPLTLDEVKQFSDWFHANENLRGTDKWRAMGGDLMEEWAERFIEALENYPGLQSSHSGSLTSQSSAE